MLDAPFLAMAQVTVYAGAIMVLFLFVIMLLGAEKSETGEEVTPWQKPVAYLLGIAMLVETVYVLLFRTASTMPQPAAATADAAFGSPAALGMVLFDAYLLPFEVTSILLLVAMVGAIVLTQRRREQQPPEKRAIRGGVGSEAPTRRNGAASYEQVPQAEGMKERVG
jgi:NADH-quinone oxidoreductase subunit J